MRAGFIDQFRLRAGQYRSIAIWAVVVAVAGLLLSAIYSFPPASSNTGFSSIGLDWNEYPYWRRAGIELPSGERPFAIQVWTFLATVSPVLYLIIIGGAIACLIKKKFKGLIVVAIAMQLASEFSTASQTHGADINLPAQAFSANLLAQADADASANMASAEPGSATLSRLCPKTDTFFIPLLGGGAMQVESNPSDTPYIVTSRGLVVPCDPRWRQNQLHSVLMQYAYLKGDAPAVKRHIDGMNALHMTPDSLMMNWRVRLAGEWAESKGFVPAKNSYFPLIMPPGVCRVISTVGLALGCVGLVIFSLFLVFSIVIRRRVVRLQNLNLGAQTS
ncbi:hypothetical protein [Asticcacaulis sp. 201]|uniref:hypothetical protein n=1 Tax=Asticcacaulis sp. 201 TaxID=3028787 RepID=UPI0029164B1E|nr:hypothetical protein [Asticcacaulis sp. 201]MDV6330137.1 hypothetical protein [Asticcacaulis sp. 201]